MHKVFIYLVRSCDDAWELLSFESHEEEGYEVPKGAVEADETPLQAARREFLEETGLTGNVTWTKLGTTRWHDEVQHFFHAQGEGDLPDRFEHVVTGRGDDRGLRYRYRWLPISSELSEQLVQGSDAFVNRLIERLYGTFGGG
jgi:8-oxo-dGTP pyrophosphatase MutT (NUDIX family)